MTDDPLFIHIAATGVAYSDRTREEEGDYAKLALLPFSTLEPFFFNGCPDPLRARIVDHMQTIRERRGEDFQVSTAGQTVQLGYALKPNSELSEIAS